MKKSAKLTTKSKSTNSQSTTDFVYGWYTDYKAKRKNAVERDFAKNPSSNFFYMEHSIRLAEVRTVANQVKITFHLPDLDTDNRIAVYRISEAVNGLTSLDDFYAEFFKLRAVSAMENDEELEQAKLINFVNSNILPNGTTVEMLCEKVQKTDNRTGRSYWTHKFPINKLVAKIYSIIEQGISKRKHFLENLKNNIRYDGSLTSIKFIGQNKNLNGTAQVIEYSKNKLKKIGIYNGEELIQSSE